MNIPTFHLALLWYIGIQKENSFEILNDMFY